VVPLVGPLLSKPASIGGKRFSELAGDECGVEVVDRRERDALDPLGGDDGVLMITEGVLQRREPLRGATCWLAGGRGDRFEGVARLLGELADPRSGTRWLYPPSRGGTPTRGIHRTVYPDARKA
jgi:hypothetical protein